MPSTSRTADRGASALRAGALRIPLPPVEALGESRYWPARLRGPEVLHDAVPVGFAAFLAELEFALQRVDRHAEPDDALHQATRVTGRRFDLHGIRPESYRLAMRRHRGRSTRGQESLLASDRLTSPD